MEVPLVNEVTGSLRQKEWIDNPAKVIRLEIEVNRCTNDGRHSYDWHMQRLSDLETDELAASQK